MPQYGEIINLFFYTKHLHIKTKKKKSLLPGINIYFIYGETKKYINIQK